jgi:hypothetical protein
LLAHKVSERCNACVVYLYVMIKLTGVSYNACVVCFTCVIHVQALSIPLRQCSLPSDNLKLTYVCTNSLVTGIEGSHAWPSRQCLHRSGEVVD